MKIYSSDGATVPAQMSHTILRIAAAMCFIGHGAFGIITKPVWCNYFAVFGIGHDTAYHLMPIVGTLDILLGLSLLVYPTAAAAGWLVIWGVVTALLRPLSGEPFAELIERAGNYGAPLALLLLSATAERESRRLSARGSLSAVQQPESLPSERYSFGDHPSGSGWSEEQSSGRLSGSAWSEGQSSDRPSGSGWSEGQSSGRPSGSGWSEEQSSRNQRRRNLWGRLKPNPDPDSKTMQRVTLCLRIAVFLLLVGHGWLNLIEKKGLIQQYTGLGFSDPLIVAHYAGLFEIAAALAILIRPITALLMILFVWKMGTELFYPHWEIFEWVERGGSYGCLLALWVIETSVRQTRKTPATSVSIL